MPPRLEALQMPPYSIRGRLLTPLDNGEIRYLADARVDVGADGRISWAGAWSDPAADSGEPPESVVDVRPWLLLPGLVDLHAHLPQVPNAGLGAGLDLLTWLDRYVFPLERDFDATAAERLAPAAFRAFAAAGTTTAVLYGAVYEDSLDVSFRAAEEHGIRVVMGKVMMDRLRYDPTVRDADVLDLSLRQTADLIARWHGRDRGRLRYAVTPRFAVSCTAEMLRESAALAASTGTYWQTHLAEDRNEIAQVGQLFPEATDYTDVYDRAGGLTPSAILAHAIHLSEREIGRLAESGARIAHCPSSNLFLASGTMPLADYLAAGLRVGLGSDVAGGPELSLFAVMRDGANAQSGLRTTVGDSRPPLTPLDWLRVGTLEGARVLGIDAEVGSLEAGKDADFICVDPAATAPLPGDDKADSNDPADIVSRLIYRNRPQMIRGAWVRGRLLAA
jgi:guanine deaminase